MMRGEGFPHQGAGTSLKRRNSHDTRHHQNIPYTDDRKRQRGSQWTNPGPPVNGSPKMLKQSGHMLHDPEVQVVDPASPSQPSAPSYGRGAHESAHPGPSRHVLACAHEPPEVLSRLSTNSSIVLISYTQCSNTFHLCSKCLVLSVPVFPASATRNKVTCLPSIAGGHNRIRSCVLG